MRVAPMGAFLRKIPRLTAGAVSAAVAVVGLLAATSPALATAATIDGPLGTTVTTPPLQLGAPGQPGPLDGTSVSAAGITVSASGSPDSSLPAGPAAPASPTVPSSPGSPTLPTTPASVPPAQQAPGQKGSPSSPSAGSQPSQAGGSRGSRPANRRTAQARARSISGSTSAESARSKSSTGGDPAKGQVEDTSNEPAAGQGRRPSVAGRIVDRVPAAYRLGLLAAVALAGGFALATSRERRRADRAEAEALIDPLTGLANRRAFDRRLEEEWKRSARYDRPLGLLMIDLDGFKQVNDSRGHKEGDRVLKQAAGSIAQRLREIDLTARIGGDEFAALCPETPGEGLDALARSLEHCLEDLPVGASIGFAEREPGDEYPSDLLSRADAAMYRRKQGRHHADPVAVG